MNNVTRSDYNAIIARLDAIGISIAGSEYYERTKRLLHTIMSTDERVHTDSGLWNFAQWVASNSVGRINALAVAVASGMNWEEASEHATKVSTAGSSNFLGTARDDTLTLVNAVELLRAARKTADAQTGKLIDAFIRDHVKK